MQSALFGKLNLKDQREIAVLDAPPSFERELRRARFIKSLKRAPQRAMSAEGRKKVAERIG